MSWPQLAAFLRYHDGKYRQEYLRRKAEAEKPDEQRVVGGKNDALPIDELNEWLGWNEPQPALEGGE